MEIGAALSEIRRVLKPGGRLVLCHLTAYDEMDKDKTFLIQKLRNPARKNFFLPQDFRQMLTRWSFVGIELFEYITRESVNRWINNAAIGKREKEEIKKVYQRAPQSFKELHNIDFKDGDIIDSMKMVIVRGNKNIFAV
jgi:DNA gyrase subunit B